MNMNARRCWLIAGLAMGVMGSSTLAQVAPPPTQPAKEEPKYEPTQQPAAPAQPTAKPINPKAPGQITRPPKGNQRKSDAVASLPTDTPYPRLAVKGEDGKIIRLKELPDILALRSNPTVGHKSVEMIMPVLYGRRARFERIVIDNLDLYWLATDGRIDTMNLSDIKNMSEIAEMIKPLVGRTTLSAELLNRGILTRTQGGMNEYIVNEYKQAVTAELQFDSQDPLAEVMRFVLQDSIHEPIQAYNAMIAETSTQIADLVKETGLTSSAATELAKLQRPLSEDPDTQRAELEEFDQAFRKLSLDEGIAILTAMRNHRSNPDLSPAIHEINVMHDRKIDISNSDAMQGTIKYSDGREIDTRKAAAAHDEKIRKMKEQPVTDEPTKVEP